MKTIEERAKAFCEKNICVDCGDRKNCDRGCGMLYSYLLSP